MEYINTLLSFLECFQLEIMFYWMGKIFPKDFNKKQELKNKDESWVDLEGNDSGYGQWVELD